MYIYIYCVCCPHIYILRVLPIFNSASLGRTSQAKPFRCINLKNKKLASARLEIALKQPLDARLFYFLQNRAVSSAALNPASTADQPL